MSTTSSSYMDIVIEDGIVHLTYHKRDFVGLEDAKKMVRDRLEFCAGTSYPHLFDISRIKKMSKEARDYFADEGNDLVSASALLVSSSVVKMIANFFIVVNKPKNPTKTFTDKHQALRWLNKFLKL